ncbi:MULTISPECIES: TetR/AcrR family transcriptional regulator [unclassified Streptomyces]|uniref:TetR/AcrR family transcriptional regulator n=1 Tax=unclassified Streptomyces TaxID=2593676 RepID=UPI00101223EB|nr:MULTISPECIES: TetR/AcrR family transcriptional regulator [unclassified Streptomyces]NJA55748.1 TetR/AcrR family transcriptional regulator [Streptomyces sp. NEAU-H3]
MAGSTQEPQHHSPTDVRVRRTWARLSEAVLRLAAERPVEEVAVSDLVRAAGVNRSTFYKHASSPADVLARVLYAELDEIRAAWIAETAAPTPPEPGTWHGATAALAEHVLRYEAVYTVGLVGQRSPVLHRLLAEHLRTSVRVYVARDPGVLPEGAGPAEWRADAWSRFVAQGQVGVMEAWLSLRGRSPRGERDVALFMGAVEAVLPSWIAPGRG